MIGEITDETNQARAFSFLPLCFAIGSIIGPILGGFLARPAEQFPHLGLFQARFWKDFPYFLPCAVSALFVLFSLIIGILYLQEVSGGVMYFVYLDHLLTPSRPSPQRSTKSNHKSSLRVETVPLWEHQC